MSVNLSHISPMEHLLVLKTLSQSQWATKVEKLVKLYLHSRVSYATKHEQKSQFPIIPTYTLSVLSA